jgi:hypothetical protein
MDMNKEMKPIRNGVEFICKGREGSEAEIFVELRTVFPGIG